MEIVNAYKNEIRKYSYYRQQLEIYKERKYVAEHEERGLIGKGTDQERVQGSQDPSIKAQRRLQLIEDIETYDAHIRKYQTKINKIDCTIGLMDEQIGSIIKRCYCLHETTLQVEAHELGYTIRQLKRKIDAEISKMSPSTLENVLI